MENTQAASYVQDWDEILGTGRRFGTANALVTIGIFTDFQCPFCRSYHATLREVMKQRPGVVAVEYFHFPLRKHSFAIPAARVAECSAGFGRFEEMANVLFSVQDSLGLVDWTLLSERAGLTDTAAFSSCFASDSIQMQVEAQKGLGEALSVLGTPTVIINGWRYSRPPTRDTLIHIIDQLRGGRSPFPARGLGGFLEEVLR
jgi:protein-disulfide isomerase